MTHVTMVRGSMVPLITKHTRISDHFAAPDAIRLTVKSRRTVAQSHPPLFTSLALLSRCLTALLCFPRCSPSPCSVSFPLRPPQSLWSRVYGGEVDGSLRSLLVNISPLRAFARRVRATLQVAFRSHTIPSGGYPRIYFFEVSAYALGSTPFHLCHTNW